MRRVPLERDALQCSWESFPRSARHYRPCRGSHAQRAPNKGAKAGLRGLDRPRSKIFPSLGEQEKARRGDARGPALLLAPPPAAAAPGGQRTHWNTQEARRHNGGRGHHFGSFPHLVSQLPAKICSQKGSKTTELDARLRACGHGASRTPGIGDTRGGASRGTSRWRRMVHRAKAYLSTASVYGGSNGDGGGKLPSLPVPSSPRPPSFPAARAHARGAGSRSLATRARARSATGFAERPLEMKLLPPPPVASSRSATGSSRLSPTELSILFFYTSAHLPTVGSTLVLFATPGFSLGTSLWAWRTPRAE